MKPVGDPKIYRPISLLCVSYKIFERLIYTRVEPLIDPLLTKKQAGFRRGKSNLDQVVLLTQNIEDSFVAKKKAGTVFICRAPWPFQRISRLDVEAQSHWTVTAAFHLNNREAKRELKVYNNDRLLPFCPTPTYLGLKLDRSLTFRHHLVALLKNLSSLVGSGWSGGAKTLRIATLSLVYSTAEYCASVWCRSAHTCLIDSGLNDALRMVTGCLRPTPTTTYLYSQASSQLSFAEWKRHSPWLTVDLWTPIISYMIS